MHIFSFTRLRVIIIIVAVCVSLLHRFKAHPDISRQLLSIEKRVQEGEITPGWGAEYLIELFAKR